MAAHASHRAVGGSALDEASWATEIQSYERERRHDVHPGLLAGPPATLDGAATARAERAFDPVLQRFRSNDREQEQLAFEAGERVSHLNRAMDVQLLREHPRSIINHSSKLTSLSGQRASATIAGGFESALAARASMPPTATDFNIVTGLPLDLHHWAAPSERPRCVERGTGAWKRKVPAALVKDFDIVTNRYKSNHTEKAERDRQLNLLEAATKQRAKNRFNPISQMLREPQEEANLRAWEDAQVTATILQSYGQQPPGLKLRHSELYNMVSLEERDPETLKVLDHAEEARKARFKNRHRVDEATREYGVQFEELNRISKLEQISHERFGAATRRGYDIVTNSKYGEGPGQQRLWLPPHTKPPGSPWELVLSDRSERASVPAISSARAASTPRRSLGVIASAREGNNASDLGSARRPTPFRRTGAPQAPKVPGGAIEGEVAISQPMSAR